MCANARLIGGMPFNPVRTRLESSFHCSASIHLNPSILHSDNGREFVNAIVPGVTMSWPGKVTIINGRPQHPQSQGLVEQGNSTAKKMLGFRFYDAHSEDEHPPWSEWLPLIKCEYTDFKI